MVVACHARTHQNGNELLREGKKVLLPFVGVLGETMRIAPQLLVQVTLGIITQTAMFLFVFYEIVRNVIFIRSEICVVAGWSLGGLVKCLQYTCYMIMTLNIYVYIVIFRA